MLPLHRVPEVHRDGDGPAVRGGEAVPADREQVGDPGERDGDGVHVEAVHVLCQGQDRLPVGDAGRVGGEQERPGGVEDERAGAARRVEHPGGQRRPHGGRDHPVREPVGCVVLAQARPVVGADDRLVQRLEHVVLDV